MSPPKIPNIKLTANNLLFWLQKLNNTKINAPIGVSTN